MAPGGTITMTTALLCFILGLLSPAPATSCCTRYNRKPVPFHRIKGYREQTVKENCHMEAIIFYTIRKNSICVTRRDAWVKKTLELLSSKLKQMSKPNSAAGETLRKKKESGNPSYNDESGSFFSSTGTFLNNTESFY